MTVGFVMLAHSALDRAAEVVRAISVSGCPVVVHVDSRVGAEFETFASEIRDLPKVSFAKRLKCEWGTWDLVQAGRDGAEALLRSYPELDHIFLISGACLPIKPIPALIEFLENQRDTDFIESVTIGEVPWTKGGLSEERFTLSFPFPWRRSRKLFDLWVELQRLIRRRRRLPSGLQPHMGSQWWCLSRSTLEKILNDDRREEFERYFRRVWIPDESYFQSLVRFYGTRVESLSLTLSKFDFQGKPHVFYDDHLSLLRQSPAFFARKVWPGADKLYRSFLDGQQASVPVTKVSPAHIDRTFVQASARRTRGRAGMVMPGRCPSKDAESAQTAAPYAVFHGFSEIFGEFASWAREATGSRVHGHLFDPDRVHFFANQPGYAGAMSDGAALRDYDPEQFLRNLIWNTRGEHQSFLFSARDAMAICPFLASDRNADIFVVTGAWVLPLLRSGETVADIRNEAALLQQKEAEFVDILNERRTRARVRIWSLAEFLERPHDPLQEIVDGLSGADSHFLAELPELLPLNGLPVFLQSLRNAGMNPHMAGEISEQVAAQFFDDEMTRFG